MGIALFATRKPRRGIRARDVRLQRLGYAALAVLTAASIASGSARADEISKDWAIQFVKAPSAWALGYTGIGVTVAVMDTGVANLSEFSGRLQPMWNAYTGKFSISADDNGHGTFVAGLIGAALNNVGTVGVAYNAKILPIKVVNKTGSLKLSDSALGNAYDVARVNGAKVSNNSWNSSTTAPDLIKAYGSSGAINVVTTNNALTLAAMQRFVTNGGVLVFAAGNDGKSDPGYWGSLPYFKPTLQPGFLTAVAVDSTGVIASWSDRCGISAAYCLAAPGVNVTSTSKTGTYTTGSGTSFSAPLVSGAVAVVMNMWPYLGAGDITQILLTSATKTGIYANTAVYGQGLLNLEAATKPIGTITIAGATTTSTGSLGQTSLSSSFASRGKATSVVVLDAFKRDFYLSSDALVVRNGDSFSMSAALSRFGAGRFEDARYDFAGASLRIASFTGANDKPWQADNRRSFKISSSDGWVASFGSQVDGAAATALTSVDQQWMRLAIADRSVGEAHAGLVQNATGGTIALPIGRASLSFGFASGRPGVDGIQNSTLLGLAPTADDHTQTLWTAGLGYRVSSGIRLTGTAGYLNERNSIFGTTQSGSMSFGTSARTSFVSIGAEIDIASGVTLFGGYDMGWTRMSGATGALVDDVSKVRSSAWRVGVRGENVFEKDDMLLFAVAQPLAATKGRLNTTTPTSYDGFTGAIGYTSGSSSLAVANRETDLQAAYATKLAYDVGLTVGGLVRFNPGNDKTAGQAVGFTRLDFRF